MGGGVATISPFTLIPEASSSPGARTALGQDSDLRSISASTLTRHRLETQLCAATEKMVDLQAQEELAGHDPGVSEVEAQLQAAREQIDVLVTRINALEENSDSAWERVIGDELPPEYV
ncbi:hypothetical protein B0H14DRAFT_3863447 [Mycena olivaceomarginata]|nr:hypothetical protein B0H14DRAFT_3863447 [Mycena olivaceomarginata]